MNLPSIAFFRTEAVSRRFSDKPRAFSSKLGLSASKSSTSSQISSSTTKSPSVPLRFALSSPRPLPRSAHTFASACQTSRRSSITWSLQGRIQVLHVVPERYGSLFKLIYILSKSRQTVSILNQSSDLPYVAIALEILRGQNLLFRKVLMSSRREVHQFLHIV